MHLGLHHHLFLVTWLTVPDTAGTPSAMYPSLMPAMERPANNHGCFLHNPMLKEALARRYAGWLLAFLPLRVVPLSLDQYNIVGFWSKAMTVAR